MTGKIRGDGVPPGRSVQNQARGGVMAYPQGYLFKVWQEQGSCKDMQEQE